MGVLMPTWLYRALALWSGILALGLFVGRRKGTNDTRRPIRHTHPPPLRFGGQGYAVLLTLVCTVTLVYVYYNYTFVQHQGRYLFPALIPIALGAALSVDALLRLFRLPDRVRPLAFAAPYLALVALDLYALWRVILPALT